MPEILAIVGGTCVLPETELADSLLVVEGDRIAWIGPRAGNDPPPGARRLDATGLFLFPGFIDTHVHGTHGDDVMLDGVEGIRRIARNFLRSGTTAWLPTTIAARRAELLRAIEACVAARERPGDGAEIVGLHIEGPYLNLARKGAQPAEGIRDPDRDECDELLAAAAGLARVMTLAPELPGGIELVRHLRQRGIIPSLGHSDADYDTALAAIEAGATHATHLFNQMGGLHHREPGLAAACLTEDGIVAELIVDGVHVAPAMVRLALRAKRPERIALITDAMAATGMPDGSYRLGSQTVFVQGNRCTLADGTLASSVLTMERGAANLAAFAGAERVAVARMASLVPARIAGCADRKGTLAVGKDADLALLTGDYDVVATIARGRIAYLAPAGRARLA